MSARSREQAVRIGTSGWSYPRGLGTWNGIFYPGQPARRPRGSPKFDELSFYAEHFDTVEVNSSFYRIPTLEAVRSWVARTPEDFEFALKLYQKFTHPEMFARATGGDPSQLGQQDVDAFRRAIEPLAQGGKLGPILAQFPASFKATPETRGYLDWLMKAFGGYALAVELRHRSWSEEAAGTRALLESYGAAWTHIDEPKFRTSIRQEPMPEGGAFYYLRLHGRNAAKWWKHETSEERYDYQYSADELKPFAEAARHAAKASRKAYVYANNHFSAKSVASAVILKHQLGQRTEGAYPEEFIAQYPDLKGIVRLLPKGLPLTPSRTPS